MKHVRIFALACMAASLSCGFVDAQTSSPADRDTTIQTGGPSGKSGAMGPNDNTNGSDKDGTRNKSPAHSRSHHRTHAGNTMAGPQ